MEVAIGVDSHQASLAAAAVDRLGWVLDAREFFQRPKGSRGPLRVGAVVRPRPSDRDRVRPGYGAEVPNLWAKKHQAKARSLLRGDRSVRAELVRRRLTEISRFDRDIAELNRRIAVTVPKTGTTLTEIPGVGPFIAAKILGEVGDPSRIRSKAAFAVLSGTALLPAASGKTQRHRLNHGGNCQLNWALHYIALGQWRVLPEAKAYIARLPGGREVSQGSHALLEAPSVQRRLPSPGGGLDPDGAGGLTT